MDERIADAVARSEITNLLGRVAQLADYGDLDEYVGCFTPDAVWELADGSAVGLGAQVRTGRTELLNGARERRAEGIQGPGSDTRHDISTPVIEVHGDAASSVTYFRYYRHMQAQPELVTAGHYRDDFVHTPDGWQVSRRVLCPRG